MCGDVRFSGTPPESELVTVKRTVCLIDNTGMSHAGCGCLVH